VVDTGKGNSMFLAHQEIKARLHNVTQRLAGTHYLSDFQGDLEAFSEEAGVVFAEVNMIHAFREGNGRAQREFLALLAARASFEINWAGVSPQAMVEACSQARDEVEPCHRKIIRLIKLNSKPIAPA
jgi:cell filamentation protein